MIRMVNHFGSITQVKMPVPYPLSFVNSYLIHGSDGLTLLDPGLNTEDARRVWERVLTEEKFNFSDIKKIVITHHHPDHYGLAGWFQERTQAPVYMSKLAKKQTELMWGEGSARLNEAIIALFREHGLPQSYENDMRAHLASFHTLVSPQPEVTLLDEQQAFMLGDERYEVIMAHGHALGQLLFYDQRGKILFCGDQVLPQITPNVSYLPQMDENPLASFYTSLQQLASLDVSQAFPGHRQPFTEFEARVIEIISHHDERLRKIQSLLAYEQTAYDICLQLFSNRLSIHQLRFAMAEVLAHIIYLHQQDLLSEHNEAGVIVYSSN